MQQQRSNEVDAGLKRGLQEAAAKYVMRFTSQDKQLSDGSR